MMQRYAVSSSLAAGVTFGLFFLMQSLIAMRGAELKDTGIGRVVEFVRLKRDEDVEVKKRELPRRERPEEPPPPDIDLSHIPKLDNQSLASVAASFRPEVNLKGGPSLGSGPSDADVVPLVRVSPQYPFRARERGIEGWVHLRFAITAAGTVEGIEIVDSDPPGYFEKAASNAVLRYKYKPKVEDGTPVERDGVEIIISFKLKR